MSPEQAIEYALETLEGIPYEARPPNRARTLYKSQHHKPPPQPDRQLLHVGRGVHRISVACFQGVRWIEAEVTRLYVGKSATSSALAAVDQKTEIVPHSAAA